MNTPTIVFMIFIGLISLYMVIGGIGAYRKSGLHESGKELFKSQKDLYDELIRLKKEKSK